MSSVAPGAPAASRVGTALDFELRIGTPTGRAVPLHVLSSPAGECSATMQFPFDTQALDSRLKDLELALVSRSVLRRRMIPEHEQAVLQFGTDLFEALFTGDVRSLLDRSRSQAVAEGKDLRIQLRFESADMAALPWEFLYDPRECEYVCLSKSTPIIRYVELTEPQKPLQVAPPLRLLAMTASPDDLPELEVGRERERIDAALAPLVRAGRLELTWVEGQTWRHLHETLRAGPWHAFHFVGHGGFDTARGEGIIALADDDGHTHRLSATDLGRLLGDHVPLRLAMLNACDGARSDRLDVFSSTAAVLVRRGTPAVVAMQYEISDSAAIELSREFYSSLAAGLPVDASLAEARKAVALANPGTLEWGTPVLYLRAPDSRIFDIDPTTVPPVDPEDDGGAGRPAWYRHRPVQLGLAAAAVVVAAVLGVLLWPRGERTVGVGEFPLELIGRRDVMKHVIEVPENSVVLLEADPGRRFDVDLGVAASHTDARRIEDYLEDAGFSLVDFEESFSGYDTQVRGQVLGRVDEGDVGEIERLVLLAPFGGRFEVVLGGAAGTRGPFDLRVTRHSLDADERGEAYIDRVLDAPFVDEFLSPAALADLRDFGGINVVPWLEGTPDPEPDVIDEVEGLDAFEGLDDATTSCLIDELTRLMSTPEFEAGSGDPTPFLDDAAAACDVDL